MIDQIWDGVEAPKLSPKLHALVQGIYNDRDSFARSTSRKIAESISDYQHATNKDLADQLFISVSIHAELWFGTLLNECLPNLDRLEPALELARRRVHQGVSLEGFLRAYRLGTVGMWEPIFQKSGNDPLLHKELLFNVSPFLLFYFDAIAREMTRAYNAEQSMTREGRLQLKRSLWEIIHSRPTDEGFIQFAELLGLFPNAMYCSLLIQPRDPRGLNNSNLEELEQQAEKFWNSKDAFIFCIAINNRLKIWLCWPEHHDTLGLLERIDSTTREFISRLNSCAFVGIGLPNAHGEGWQESLNQAQKAHSQCTAENPIAHYSDIALVDNLQLNKSVYAYYVSLAQKLAQDPKLIETVNVWISQNQHRKASANKLGIHPNTLDHRLDRLVSLLGGSLTEPAIVAKLDLALRLGNFNPSGKV